jgi:hypothetical protein
MVMEMQCCDLSRREKLIDLFRDWPDERYPFWVLPPFQDHANSL